MSDVSLLLVHWLSHLGEWSVESVVLPGLLEGVVGVEGGGSWLRWAFGSLGFAWGRLWLGGDGRWRSGFSLAKNEVVSLDIVNYIALLNESFNPGSLDFTWEHHICSHPPSGSWRYFNRSTVEQVVKLLIKGFSSHGWSYLWLRSLLNFFRFSRSLWFGVCFRLSFDNGSQINFWNILLFFNHYPNECSTLHFGTVRAQDFCNVSVFLTLIPYSCLVSLDIAHYITYVDFTTLGYVPLNNSSFRHGWWQSWHLQFHNISWEHCHSIIASNRSGLINKLGWSRK